MNLAFTLLLSSLSITQLYGQLVSSSAGTESTGVDFTRRLQFDEDDTPQEDTRYKVWDFSEDLIPRKVVGVRYDEMFGSSVSIWDQYMVVGAPGDRNREFASGAVYVYSKAVNSDGSYYWDFLEILEPWDGAEGDGFGAAVDLHLYTLVVGASMHDSHGQDAGAAYIYECYNNNPHHHHEEEEDEIQRRWYLAAELKPEEGRPQDYFGSAVATQGNFTAVAAYGSDIMATFSGAVFIWRKTWTQMDPHHPWQWVYDEMLAPSDGQRYDHFGTSLAIFGNRLVVGANGVDENDHYKVGAVYVYHNTYDDSATDGVSFQLLSKLTPGSRGVTYESFGQSVSLWGNNLVVGAPNAAAQGITGAGAFYSFGFDKYNKPYFIEKVLPQQPSLNAHCGFSVDLYEDLAAIGCPNASTHGSVHLFTEVSSLTTPSTKNIHWLFESQKKVSDEQRPMFGHAVSVYDDMVTVGAYMASSSLGATYTYVGKKKVYQDLFANETDDDEVEVEDDDEGAEDFIEEMEEMLVAFEEAHPRETKVLVLGLFLVVLAAVSSIDRRRRGGADLFRGRQDSYTQAASYELTALESSHGAGSSSVSCSDEQAWGDRGSPLASGSPSKITFSPMSTGGGSASSGDTGRGSSQRVRDLAAAGLLAAARPAQSLSAGPPPPAPSSLPPSSPYAFRPDSGQ